ncbi:MAG: thiamine biosynthesis protein ThiF [Phycisphaerae bacterium]|nr:thiamine biosynthesis protein ThiF [Phycisphaerae bacterium]
MNGSSTTDRHHRQRLLPVIGDDGQRSLAASTVLVAGCGALGTVAADLLCRAGVGTLVLVDRDVVELTNLQRQTLYTERDAARSTPKAEAARLRLGQVDENIRLRAFVEDIAPDTVEELADGCDLLLDGLDNFETRYLLNDLAVKRGLPYLYGGAIGTGGMTMPVLPRSGPGVNARIRWTSDQSTPCLRCLFPDPPPPGVMPTCDTAGVLGSITATIAARLATEAIKVLVGDLESVDRTLRRDDLWKNQHHALSIDDAFDRECGCCVHRRFEFLEATGPTTRMLCGRNAVQIRSAPGSEEVDLAALQSRLAARGRFELQAGMLRGVLADEVSPTGDPVAISVFPDGRIIVEGDTDTAWARGVHARILGH